MKSVRKREVSEFFDGYDPYLKVITSPEQLCMGEKITPIELKFCINSQLLESLVRYELEADSVEELSNEEI